MSTPAATPNFQLGLDTRTSNNQTADGVYVKIAIKSPTAVNYNRVFTVSDMNSTTQEGGWYLTIPANALQSAWAVVTPIAGENVQLNAYMITPAGQESKVCIIYGTHQ